MMIACISRTEEMEPNASLSRNSAATELYLSKLSHRFSFDSTAILIADLLNKPALTKFSSSYASGGTLPARFLKTSSDSDGIIFWFCFKPGKNPELFLAFEHLKEFDIYNMPKQPASDYLIRPQTTFRINNQKKDVAFISDQIQQQEMNTKMSVTYIDKASVLTYLNSFDSLMNVMRDSKGEKYNEYPFSYFRESKDGLLKQFLNQAGEEGYVNYYFGLDETMKANRIRVMLLAASPSVKGSTARIKTDALALQHSWPPPPPEDGN